MKNIKNSIYGVSDALVLPILMLIGTPIFLHYLGVEGYATWVLINSIIASLSFFNFGGADVVIKFVSSSRSEKSRSDESKGEAVKVFSTVFAFQALTLLMIYGLFIIAASFMDQLTISKNLLLFVEILYIAIPVFFFKQSEQLLYAFLRGKEQFAQVLVMSGISKVLFFTIQMVISIFTQSVIYVFYGALIISILLFLLQVSYIKFIQKENISFSGVNINTAKSLLNFGGWNWASSLASMLKSDSDKWLVSWLLGLKVFGFYSIGVMVFNQLHRIVASSIAWIFPDISKNSLSKEYLSKKYWKLLFSVGVLGLLISFSLTSLSALFELWLGKEFYQDGQYYISTFLLIFPMFTMTIVPYFYLLGLGLVKPKFFVDIASLVAKVVTIWLVISVLNIKEWVLFFLIFIVIEYIAYSVVISRNLPIKFLHMIYVLLLQMVIVLLRF